MLSASLAQAINAIKEGESLLPQDLAIRDTDPGAASPIHRRFRDKIAERESGAAGYRARNEKGALGRYQLTLDALVDIGWKQSDGTWTGRFGITSDDAFLADPEAQKHAFAEYMERTRLNAEAVDLFSRLNQTIDGIVAPFEITEAGIMAAAHRRGAGKVKEYFDHIEATNWRSDPSTFPSDMAKKFREIETRLREFSQDRYLRPFPRKHPLGD